MDSVLKDRLESINSRIMKSTKSMNKQTVKQKLKLYQLENNVEHAYNAWSNSSLNQDEALKAYQGLFPAGKCIELGPVQLRGNKSTTAFSVSNNFGVGGRPYNKHNDSTMSNTLDTKKYHHLEKKKNSLHNKTSSDKSGMRGVDSLDSTLMAQKKDQSDVNMSKSSSVMKIVANVQDEETVAVPKEQQRYEKYDKS
jgi:hypothetical protein